MAQKLLRGAALVVILLAIAAGLAYFNFTLAALFAVAALFALILKYAAPGQPWLKVLIVAAAVATAFVVWKGDGLPGHVGVHSSGESRLPVVGPTLSSLPDAYYAAAHSPQLDEVAQARDELRGIIRRLRAQANTVEQALAIKDLANDVVAFGQKQNRPTDKITSAKDALNDALTKRQLGSLEQLRAFQNGLEAFLQEAELAMPKATTAPQLRELITNVRLQAVARSADGVNDQLIRLEEAIDSLQRDAIAGDIRITADSTALLDEKNDRLIRTQFISLKSNRYEVRTLDASQLMLDRDPTALGDALTVAFGPDLTSAVPVGDASRIPIRPGVRQVTLIKRTVLPANLKDLHSSLRLATFRYFFLDWPPPSVLKLRTTLSLAADDGPKDYPYAFDLSTDAPIRELRLPVASFFYAGYAFNAPRREGDEDVLESTPPLMPAYFLTHEGIWIELMPDHWAFRNDATQQAKGLLFGENLLAALVAVLAGLVVAALFPT